MTASADQVEVAELRARRFRIRLNWLAVLFVIAGVVVVYATLQDWFTVSFDGAINDGGVWAQADVTHVTASEHFTATDIAEIPNESHFGHRNPTTDSMGPLPKFATQTLIALLLATLGVVVGNSAFTLLSLPFLYFANGNAKSAYNDFVEAFLDSGFVVQEELGASLFANLFWIVTLTASLSVVAAWQYQRAERAARIARGEQVEETGFERLERLIVRTNQIRNGEPASSTN